MRSRSVQIATAVTNFLPNDGAQGNTVFNGIGSLVLVVGAAIGFTRSERQLRSLTLFVAQHHSQAVAEQHLFVLHGATLRAQEHCIILQLRWVPILGSESSAGRTTAHLGPAYPAEGEGMIVVTGATGELGSAVVENLLQHTPASRLASAHGKRQPVSLHAEDQTLRHHELLNRRMPAEMVMKASTQTLMERTTSKRVKRPKHTLGTN